MRQCKIKCYFDHIFFLQCEEGTMVYITALDMFAH